MVLVGPNLESNLSLGYLSSSLKQAGHSTVICPFTTAEDTTRVLEAAADADVVGLSLCFQVRAPQFLRLARALKEQRPERPVIAGGHFATCAAAELLRDHPALDLIVLHEGERFYVRGNRAGYRFLGRKPFQLNAIGRVNAMGYDSGDSDFLAGMDDRDPAFELGGPTTPSCSMRSTSFAALL